MTCRKAVRVAKRAAKAARIGAPGLTRWRDTLHIADSLYSVALRARAAVGTLVAAEGHTGRDVHSIGCEMCGNHESNPKSLQCAHGWSRVSMAIRFNGRNTFALCSHCHMRNTPRNSDAVEAPVWRAWCEMAVGAEAWALVSAARRGGLPDLGAVMMAARLAIEALPIGDVRDWGFERMRSIDNGGGR